MAGFETRYTYPNLLNINWAHHEKSYILEQSPIMQAMLESDEKKRSDEERKAIFSRRLLGKAKSGGIAAGKKKVEFRKDAGAPSVGHSLSASDYIPPVSFMKQMTEPPKTTVGGPSVTLAPSSAFADLWRS
jgi:phosphoenolpyruvate synthase/pyruvate phosphate dikinase